MRDNTSHYKQKDEFTQRLVLPSEIHSTGILIPSAARLAGKKILATHGALAHRGYDSVPTSMQSQDRRPLPSFRLSYAPDRHATSKDGKNCSMICGDMRCGIDGKDVSNLRSHSAQYQMLRTSPSSQT
jgi:hypothetical protein